MMKQTRIIWENEIKHLIKGRLPDEVWPVVKARVNRTKKTETLTRLEKDGMTRGKRPTTGNGVGASSLEIRTGNLSKSVTLWTCI